jgi:itaconyl-CoA hydratase
LAGLFFEDFAVGAVFNHDSARSVTQFDNTWYSCMTLNTQPLHINLDFSERNGLYKKPLFNSMYTLSIVVGQTSSDLTHGTLLRTLLLDDIQFPRPTFAGDTLYSRTTVLSRTEENERSGTIELLHEGRNQHGELVASCKRTVLVRKRPVGSFEIQRES